MIAQFHRSSMRPLRAALVAAMIPVALWSTRPSAGCFCADGHFELVCAFALAAGPSGDPRNRCSCCPAAAEQQAAPIKSCCHRPKPAAPSSSVVRGQASTDCCSPATQDEILLVSAAEFEQPLQTALFVPMAVEPFDAEAIPAAFGAFPTPDSRSRGDRIVALRRLLI